MKCFLSHNSKNKPLARRIGNILIDRNIDVWFDAWEIKAGESLTGKIGEGIMNSDIFIILLSPDSVNSKWVQEELKIGLHRRINEDNFKVIPILVEDCNIPPFLLDYLYINWQGNEETNIESLLQAIFEVSTKPKVHVEEPLFSLVTLDFYQKLKFTGHKGKTTYIIEKSKFKVANSFEFLTKRMYFDGSISDIESQGVLSAEIEEVSKNNLLIKFVPDRIYEVGEIIETTQKYSLSDCFSKDLESWNVHIDTPFNGNITIELDFSESDIPKSLSCFKREGIKSKNYGGLNEKRSGVYVWNKPFPRHKDTFEFKIKWK